ncbi:MAG: hypothetical protein ABSG95_01725 [Solirubrobacteraceae bacterium]|jgi:hypothetical protein
MRLHLGELQSRIGDPFVEVLHQHPLGHDRQSADIEVLGELDAPPPAQTVISTDRDLFGMSAPSERISDGRP